MEEILVLFRKLAEKFDSLETVLKGVIRTSESAEDTLLNVLLAIRQNEAYQAWYPAQNGFPEMKVSGSHPAGFVAQTHLRQKAANENS